MQKQLLLITVMILVPVAAGAQSNPADAKIDCAAFVKKADGSWEAVVQTTIELGNSKITIAPGDIEPRVFQYGMADLYGVLQTSCPDKKAEPSPKVQNQTLKRRR